MAPQCDIYLQKTKGGLCDKIYVIIYAGNNLQRALQWDLPTEFHYSCEKGLISENIFCAKSSKTYHYSENICSNLTIYGVSELTAFKLPAFSIGQSEECESPIHSISANQRSARLKPRPIRGDQVQTDRARALEGSSATKQLIALYLAPTKAL